MIDRMNTVLNVTTTVIALIMCVAGIVGIVRSRLPGWYTLAGLAVLELAVIAAVTVTAIELANTTRELETVTIIGYLIGLPLLIPAAIAWVWSDGSRQSLIAIVVACLGVPVMLARVQQILEGTGAA